MAISIEQVQAAQIIPAKLHLLLRQRILHKIENKLHAYPNKPLTAKSAKKAKLPQTTNLKIERNNRISHRCDRNLKITQEKLYLDLDLYGVFIYELGGV
jgi:hypothetical protein